MPDLFTARTVFSHSYPTFPLRGKRLTLTPAGPNLLLTSAGYQPLEALTKQDHVIVLLHLNHLQDCIDSHGRDFMIEKNDF